MTPGTLVLDEPFGHRDQYSKIERAWRDMPWGTSLRRRRTERFDPLSSVLYGPVEYEYVSIVDELPTVPPSSEWIDEAFRSFVRGEFGASSTRTTPSDWNITIRNESSVGVDALQLFRDTCESRYIYAEPVSKIGSHRGTDMVGAIFDLLCDANLGHKKNATNVSLDDFRRQVTPLVEGQDRLTFVLPSFPFKDQNRFRTYSGAATVDLGELSLLIRLHCLALALYQVHPFGVDIVILADGLLYADVFGVKSGLALRYRERLRELRNLLNIQGTVSILDLSELISRFKSDRVDDCRVSQCLAAIRSRLASYADRADDLTSEQIHLRWPPRRVEQTAIRPPSLSILPASGLCSRSVKPTGSHPRRMQFKVRTNLRQDLPMELTPQSAR